MSAVTAPPLPAHGRRAGTAGPALGLALLACLFAALQFGPAIGLVGYRLSGLWYFALVGAARDLLVVGLLALGALAWLARPPAPLPASARWALAMVLVYAAFGLAGDESLPLVALNLRRLVLVPLLFVALWLIPWSRAQIRLLFALVLWSCVAVALIGIAERLAPNALWTDALEIDRYTQANPFDRFGHLPFDQSGRYFSWDLEPLAGVPLRRMISTYLEATTLAAAMALGLVLALARRSAVLALLFLACGLLTLSKGFLLFLCLLAGYALLGWPSPRQVFMLAALAAAAALGLVSMGHVDGPFAHVDGLASALRYLAEGGLLGEGLGAAGNLTNSDTDVGSESGLGNAIAQVGVAALLPFVWVRALAGEVLQAAAARGDGGRWLAAWLLFWFGSFLMSASSLGVGGNALGFALLALYLHPAWGARR
jgi:hypothetical protein